MSKVAVVSASAALLLALSFGGPATAGQADRSGIANADRYEISAQTRREMRRERRAMRREVRRDRRMARRAAHRQARADVHGAYTPFFGYQASAWPYYRPAYLWDYPLAAATTLALLPFAAIGGDVYAQAPAGEPVVSALY